MSSFKYDYVLMMQNFVDQVVPTTEFVSSYLNKFKTENRALDEEEFAVLDELFGDADAYTSDDSLIAENPSFFIDERQLRERVASAIEKLT